MIRVLWMLCALAVAGLIVDRTTHAQQTSAAAQTGSDSDSDPTETLEAPEARAISFESARQTLTTFVEALDRDDYRTATSALDYSQCDPEPDDYVKSKLARRLGVCIDGIALVDYDKLSDLSEGPPVPLPPGSADSEIMIARGDDGQWRFASETVMRIDAMYQLLQDHRSEKPEPTVEEQPISTAETGTKDKKEKDESASAVVVPDELASARRTLRTLFDALDDRDYESAVATLDFSQLEQTDLPPTAYQRLSYARRLKDILERIAPIDYAEISDDPQSPTFRFPPNRVSQPIEIIRDPEGFWRFSSATVDRIEALHELYKDKPIVNLPEDSKPWYDRQLILGNETWRILALFGTIFLSILIGQFLRGLLRWRASILERRGHKLRAAVVRTIATAVVGVAFLIGLHAGTSGLVLGHQVGSLVETMIQVTFVIVISYVCFRLVDVVVALLQERAERSGSALNNMLAPIVSTSMRVTIIVLAALEIATAISDQPPSAVLAGLGAGGLAVGLAAQETIKNVFGSVMIFADRPFELGDRIVVDGYDGPVERVGFRSTRIRTLQGHYVTVPNGEMANRTIENIGKRPYIRRSMSIRIASDTAPGKIREALRIVRELVENHEGRHEDYPPRVFLEDFLESALSIRVIYWYHPPAYWDYCDYGERLNLQVIEAFYEAGIHFAVPSQRLVVTRDSDNPLGPDSANS